MSHHLFSSHERWCLNFWNIPFNASLIAASLNVMLIDALLAAIYQRTPWGLVMGSCSVFAIGTLLAAQLSNKTFLRMNV
jgi:hypothetical protein